MNGAMTFLQFRSKYSVLGEWRIVENQVTSCYEVLWIHNIDAICIIHFKVLESGLLTWPALALTKPFDEATLMTSFVGATAGSAPSSPDVISQTQKQLALITRCSPIKKGSIVTLSKHLGNLTYSSLQIYSPFIY